MLLVWAFVAAAEPLARLTGAGASVVLCSAAATLACAPGALRSAQSPRARSSFSLFRAATAGWALVPGIAAVTLTLGAALGLPPRAATARPTVADAFAALTLAPVFEEALYRGRLLPAIERIAGAPAALGASTLLFALPHLEPWALLGTASAGSLLGLVFLRTRRILDCIALHAGMNAHLLAWADRAHHPAQAPWPIVGASLAVAALLLLLLLRAPPPRHALRPRRGRRASRG